MMQTASHRAQLTLFLLALLSPCIAARVAAEELEFVTGAFRFLPVFGIDFLAETETSLPNQGDLNDIRQSLKYPLVCHPDGRNALVFLASFDKQTRIYAYRLDELLDRSDWRRRLPLLRWPDAWQERDELRKPPPQITAYFQGGAFTEKTGDQVSLRSIQAGAKLPQGKPIRDFRQWRGVRAWVDSDGLKVKGTLFFECREVSAVDSRPGLFAIGFQDSAQRFRVCLRANKAKARCQCDPLPEGNQYEPAFSADGRFLAVATRNGGHWDLYIYALDQGSDSVPKPEQVATQSDVAFYDVTTDSFVYRGSYSWAGRGLFYKPKMRNRGDEKSYAEMRRSVKMVTCIDKSCEAPQTLLAPPCIRLRAPEGFPTSTRKLDAISKDLIWLDNGGTCGDTPELPTLDVDVDEIEWIQTFERAGSTYLATQAIVRPRYSPDLKQTQWMTRILIFRVP